MARGVFTAATTLTAAALNDCFDPPRCRVRNSAAISIATATVTALTFDTETQDVGGMHSTSVNTGRITVPTGGDGTYLIGAAIDFNNNATGRRDLNIRLNGATVIGSVRNVTASGTVTSRLALTVTYPLVAGDYLEVTVYQDSGGNLNVNSSADFTPIFFATWLAI